MTPSVALSPVNRLWLERFTELSGHGLFAAPWTSTIAESALDLEEMCGALFHASTQAGDLPAVLGSLLSVRRHCLWASKATDPGTARSRYHNALAACQDALGGTHDTESVTVELAAWAQGVHTLILAQKAMPYADESRELAARALERLHEVHGPICAGAEADRQAALTLMNEPEMLASQLKGLPYRLLDALNHAKSQTELHENLMNLRLTEVRERHAEAFRSVLAWFAANLVLVATLPLNAVYFTSVPWSLPFLLGLLTLWWWTYTRPYRDGLYFFTWLTWSKSQSLDQFCEAAKALPNPGADLAREANSLLADGRRDRDRLTRFYLFALPSDLDTLQEAEKIDSDGQALLAGTWMAELDDRHPWLVADLLPVAPFMLPHAVRVWHGTSAH